MLGFQRRHSGLCLGNCKRGQFFFPGHCSDYLMNCPYYPVPNFSFRYISVTFCHTTYKISNIYFGNYISANVFSFLERYSDRLLSHDNSRYSWVTVVAEAVAFLYDWLSLLSAPLAHIFQVLVLSYSNLTGF